DLCGWECWGGASKKGSAPRREREREPVLLDALVLFLGMAVARGPAVDFTVAPEQHDVVCLAKPGCRLCKRVQHGLQIERRAADDLEHVGGGGLLLQRFGEIVRALAQLFQQPGGLCRDDGPCSAGLSQVDLLVIDGAPLWAVNGNDDKCCFFLKQRDCEHGSQAIFHKNGP